MRSLVLAGCAALCLALSFVVVSGSSNVTSLEVSSRTAAVIHLDHLYAAQLRAQAYKEKINKPVGQMEASMNYDYDTATALMWHSVTAYCADDPALHDWTCTSCTQFGPFTVTEIMDDTANVGYVGYFTQGLPASPIDDGSGRVSASDPFVVISMRGTVPSDLKDWIEDLSFSKFAAFSDEYPDVSVHSGFFGAYMDMKPKMMSGLATALQASGATTVIVTGHSLGAAMAELAAIDLKINEYPWLNYASFTQGCPRVGNADFSALYTSLMNSSFREIHNADIVPHLPPLLLNFVHGPTEIWFAEDWSTYNICNSTMDGEDPNCSNSLLAPISIPDHLTYRGVDLGGYCTSSSTKQAKPKPTLLSLEELDTPVVQAPIVVEKPTPAPAQKAKKPKIILDE